MPESTHYQWSFPQAVAAANRRHFSASILTLSVITIFNSSIIFRGAPRASVLLLVSINVSVLLIAMALLWSAYLKLEGAVYQVDEEGVRRSPGFNLPWSEIKGVVPCKIPVSEARTLLLKTRIWGMEKRLTFNAADVNEQELLAFIQARIGK